jgi:hypothetical protein
MGKGERTSLIRTVVLLIGAIALGYVVLFPPSGHQRSISPAKSFILLSFDDFDNLVGGRDRMPHSHRKALMAQYRGKYVRWSGELFESEKLASGHYLLKVRQRINTDDFDVILRVGPSKERRVSGVSGGEGVSYTGRLVSLDHAGRYHLEDGDIE